VDAGWRPFLSLLPGDRQKVDFFNRSSYNKRPQEELMATAPILARDGEQR